MALAEHSPSSFADCEMRARKQQAQTATALRDDGLDKTALDDANCSSLVTATLCHSYSEDPSGSQSKDSGLVRENSATIGLPKFSHCTRGMRYLCNRRHQPPPEVEIQGNKESGLSATLTPNTMSVTWLRLLWL